MSEPRKIEPYIRRDDISWWAGCRYAERLSFERSYISETPCLTRWGSVRKSRRMAVQARRLRDKGLSDFSQATGPAA